MTFKDKWMRYLADRRGTYAYRSRTRYKGVYDKLRAMGLEDGHSILDLGAGDCHFGRYIYEQGWRGTYRPVDASIDGTDLERYRLPDWPWIVAIEVVEHLIRPMDFLSGMVAHASRGAVITTPNCRVVDVVGCDPTHVSIVTIEQLRALGFAVKTESWFSEKHQPSQQDTLLAWRER